jgi:lipopolysaccharide/colanic/teichoic acid biosynthesis glycosyltransferase
MLFVQQRIGKNEKLFRVLKFRTLQDTEGSNLKERTFWLGNFLRATSLDELPQVINVLKGEMSLVGPRPLPVAYGTLFSETQRKRHDVLPGITGYAQVNGRHSISWTQKFQHDIFYVNNISFWLDLKILFKTIVLVLSFKKDESLNEQKFTG